MDMDISMDIHAKICGYGYGWEISYPRQAWFCPKAGDANPLFAESETVLLTQNGHSRSFKVIQFRYH